MIWLDWTILGIVALSTLISLRRGFVKEALSLLAWVVAFVVSTRFSERLALLLTDYIANDALREVSAYVILFAATLMLGSLLNTLLSQVIRFTGLSGADRVLGTAFGLARGLLIVVVLVFVLESMLNADEQAFMQDSRLLPHLAMVEQWAQDVFAEARISEKLALPDQ
jgi:membrane protein required for colicin V production